MSSGLLKIKVTYKSLTHTHTHIYIYKQNLALNNLQGLISLKPSTLNLLNFTPSKGPWKSQKSKYSPSNK